MTGRLFRRRNADPAPPQAPGVGPGADPAESWDEERLADALAADVPDHLLHGDA